MKRLMNAIKVYKIVIYVVLMLFGWIVITRTDDYLYITMYPMYCALFLFSFAIYKNHHQDFDTLTLSIMKKECYLKLGYLLIWVLVFIFSLAYEIAPAFLWVLGMIGSLIFLKLMLVVNSVRNRLRK